MMMTRIPHGLHRGVLAAVLLNAAGVLLSVGNAQVPTNITSSGLGTAINGSRVQLKLLDRCLKFLKRLTMRGNPRARKFVRLSYKLPCVTLSYRDMVRRCPTPPFHNSPNDLSCN